MHAPPQIVAVMTPFPYAVDIEAPLSEAHTFMRSKHVHHLPVMDGGELVGIVTERDINLVLGPDFAYPDEEQLNVRDAYVDEPYIVDVSAPLDEVVLTMADKRIGSALVTKSGKLAGIFTTHDACRAFGEDLQKRFRPEPGNSAA